MKMRLKEKIFFSSFPGVGGKPDQRMENSTHFSISILDPVLIQISLLIVRKRGYF